MTRLNDKQLDLCRKNLYLIKGFVHYCGLQELGVYTSVGKQIMQLVDEIQVTLTTSSVSANTSSQSQLLKKVA